MKLTEICLNILAQNISSFSKNLLENLGQETIANIYSAADDLGIVNYENWLLFITAAPEAMANRFPEKKANFDDINSTLYLLKDLAPTELPFEVDVRLFIGEKTINFALVSSILKIPRVKELDLRSSHWPNDLDKIDRSLKALDRAMTYGNLRQLRVLRLPSRGPPYLRQALKKKWKSLLYIQSPIKPDSLHWVKCSENELSVPLGKFRLEVNINGIPNTLHRISCFKQLSG